MQLLAMLNDERKMAALCPSPPSVICHWVGPLQRTGCAAGQRHLGFSLGNSSMHTSLERIWSTW